MARTITISGTQHARLAQFGLNNAPEPETMEFRNERPSGYGDDEGEWFATVENHVAPDGRTYHVLITGTYANDHSPGASHYTSFELYPTSDPESVARFAADVKEWEAKPETDPDYESETDDEDSDDDPPPLPEGTDHLDYGLTIVDANEDGIAYKGEGMQVDEWLRSKGFTPDANPLPGQDWRDIHDANGNRVGQIDERDNGQWIASMDRTALGLNPPDEV